MCGLILPSSSLIIRDGSYGLAKIGFFLTCTAGASEVVSSAVGGGSSGPNPILTPNLVLVDVIVFVVVGGDKEKALHDVQDDDVEVVSATAVVIAVVSSGRRFLLSRASILLLWSSSMQLQLIRAVKLVIRLILWSKL